MTAAFRDSKGLMFEKKIDTPGWERSSTRKSNLGIGQDFGPLRGCCRLGRETGLLGGGGGGGGIGLCYCNILRVIGRWQC